MYVRRQLIRFVAAEANSYIVQAANKDLSIRLGSIYTDNHQFKGYYAVTVHIQAWRGKVFPKSAMGRLLIHRRLMRKTQNF